jgi:L-amino acid N-acyltransferase YncA
MLIVTTTTNKLGMHQIYIKITLLNCDLDEEVYIEQSKGFIVNGKEKKVCKLVKSLYGLKQIPK